MEGKDSGKKPEDSKSSNLQVSSEDLTQLISYLQELQVKDASTQASSSGGFSLSPGTTMWQLWTMYNMLIFQKKYWNHALVCLLIWQSILDYGRVAWAKCLAKITECSSAQKKTLRHFNKQWCQSTLLCSRVNFKVTWSRLIPTTGIG
jgi:hypothetical protein